MRKYCTLCWIYVCAYFSDLCQIDPSTCQIFKNLDDLNSMLKWISLNKICFMNHLLSNLPYIFYQISYRIWSKSSKNCLTHINLFCQLSELALKIHVFSCFDRWWSKQKKILQHEIPKGNLNPHRNENTYKMLYWQITSMFYGTDWLTNEQINLN